MNHLKKFFIFFVLGLSLVGCVNRVQPLVQRQGTVLIENQGQRLWLKFYWDKKGEIQTLKLRDWSGGINFTIIEKQNQIAIWQRNQLLNVGDVEKTIYRQLGWKLPWKILENFFTEQMNNYDAHGVKGRVVYKKDGSLRKVIFSNNFSKITFYL